MVRFGEEIVGNYAVVYHGTATPEIILNTKFEPNHGKGSMYGRGIYSVYELAPGGNTQKGAYGPTIIKMAIAMGNILNIDKMRDSNNLFSKKLAEAELERIKFPLDKRDLIISEIAKGSRHQKLTSTAALRISQIPELKQLLHGMVYTGHNDGRCIVIYDIRNYLPIGISTDHGQTWTKPVKNEFLQAKAKELFSYNASITTIKQDPAPKKSKLIPVKEPGAIVAKGYSTLESLGRDFEAKRITAQALERVIVDRYNAKDPEFSLKKAAFVKFLLKHKLYSILETLIFTKYSSSLGRQLILKYAKVLPESLLDRLKAEEGDTVYDEVGLLNEVDLNKLSHDQAFDIIADNINSGNFAASGAYTNAVSALVNFALYEGGRYDIVKLILSKIKPNAKNVADISMHTSASLYLKKNHNVVRLLPFLKILDEYKLLDAMQLTTCIHNFWQLKAKEDRDYLVEAMKWLLERFDDDLMKDFGRMEPLINQMYRAAEYYSVLLTLKADPSATELLDDRFMELLWNTKKVDPDDERIRSRSMLNPSQNELAAKWRATKRKVKESAISSFLKEMDSGGVAAFAPEHMNKLIDISKEDSDDTNFDVFTDSK